MSQVQWKTLLIKIIIWLMAEIGLTYLGLDNFADYSEFLDDRNLIILKA